MTVDEAVDEIMEAIGKLGDDTRQTPLWSKEFYEMVSAECTIRAEAIAWDLRQQDNG